MRDEVLSEACKCDLPGVPPEVRESLLQFSNNPSGGEISVNLERRIVTAGQISAPFEMDDATRTALIRGRDDTAPVTSQAIWQTGCKTKA